MKRICVVCGKEFNPKRTAITCSEECRVKRRQERVRQYYHEHADEIKSYQREYAQANKAKEEQKKQAQKREYKLHILKANEDDPQWIKDYCSADRLTQVTMLAIALTDYQIQLMTYGKLSQLWLTDQYLAWEKQVFKLKRKDFKNAKAKDTIKSKNRT